MDNDGNGVGAILSDDPAALGGMCMTTLHVFVCVCVCPQQADFKFISLIQIAAATLEFP